MASASPAPAQQTPSAQSEPKIQHNFDGDVNILNGTFDSRMEVRKALSNLQQTLARMEGLDVQVAADIKIRIGGAELKENTYSVTVNDSRLDVEAFATRFSRAKKRALSMSSPAVSHANGQRGGHRAAGDDDDVVEIRPSKKARTSVGDGAVSSPPSQDTAGLLREVVSMLKQRSSTDTLEFMKQWHTEWVKQGGWLFDTMNKVEKLLGDNLSTTSTKMGSVQDVLGQSMNAASASTMTELTNISKLIPWLEHCRKTAADKSQAREEKWRTSSATFHDQSRRERESGEKRLQDELNKQRALLIKIAEANGVDVDEEEKDESRGTREASLGAQLTAELNQEANRVNEKGEKESDKPRETINVDDDDDK